jgi:hypothetical protein
MRQARYSHAVQEALEVNFTNQREAFEVLELIVAEFNSDPMSVRCFDLRVVERAKQCVAKRKAFLASPEGWAYK